MKSPNQLLVIIALLLFTAFQHQVVSAQGTVTVARGGNVVARPTATDSILAQVKEGNVLTLLQMDNDWAKVALSKKKRGWLRRELLKLPSLDSAVISRDWPVMQERGFDWRPADTAKAKAGFVRKGMNVKRILAQGAWYEIELADGVSGWLPHHVIEASPIEIIRLGSETNLIPDTTNHLNNTRSVGHVVEGTKLIQLSTSPRWSKGRTPAGWSGWFEQSLREIEGALPRKATS